MATTTSVVSLEALMEKIGKPNYIETMDELKEMLTFFHKRGFVAFYEHHPDLKNCVITQPSTFIDAIASVITTK